MNDADDKLLLETIVAGDPQAFRPFIRKYERLVGHIVSRMVRNQADREDIGQEIFVKIYRNLPQFQFRSKISTWVAQIAYHTCLNYLQKKRPTLLADISEDEEADPFCSVPDKTPTPDQWTENREMGRYLQEAIQSLTPVYATVLTMFHVDEFKYQEIAEIMDLPEGTIKSYLFRARKMVKERLVGSLLEEAI
jgi:RNA polymerase sigma factor (sigma-70 family)